MGWGKRGRMWEVDIRNFRFSSPVGYTFGVLAFLRSLQGWGPGMEEERDAGREWEVDERNF